MPYDDKISSENGSNNNIGAKMNQQDDEISPYDQINKYANNNDETFEQNQYVFKQKGLQSYNYSGGS